MELFRLFGTIAINNDDALKALDETTKKSMKSEQTIGQSFGKIGKTATNMGQKMLPATLAVGAMGIAAIKSASDTAESMNKVEVAFGDAAKPVKEFASTSLKTYGIAEGTALDMTSLFGDMATSMGLPQNEAAKMSISMTGLAGDLASFKNIGVDEAMTALNGVFTGETESLKRLGIVMTQTNLDAYALANGFGKTTAEMTQGELVNLRYSYVMSMTKNAQGDFARTSDGTANSMRIFTETVKELAAKFGKVLLPTITPIIKKATEILEKFENLDDGTKKLIVKIGGLVAIIAPLLIAFGKMSTGIGAIIDIHTKFRAAMALSTAATTTQTTATVAQRVATIASSAATTLATAAQAAFNAVLNMNPIMLVIGALGALVVGLTAYSVATADAKTETESMGISLGELNASVNEYNEKMGELAETRKTTIEDGMGEMNYYAALKQELTGLVDANGRVKQGYEERAGFIIDTLNNALGIEIKMNGGVVDSYGEICDAVDGVIEKKRAEIILSAYEEEYKTALKERAELLDGLATKQEAFNTANQALSDYMSNGGNESTRQYENLKNAVDGAKKSMDDYYGNVEDNASAIANYETMSTDIMEGNYNRVTTAVGGLSTAITDLSGKNEAELIKIRDDTALHLEAAKNYYATTGDESTKAYIEEQQKKLDATNSSLAQISSTIENDTSIETATKNNSDRSKTAHKEGLTKQETDVDSTIVSIATKFLTDTTIPNAVNTNGINANAKINKQTGNAETSVGNSMTTIKGKTDFEWSLPSLALPVLSASGSFATNPAKVPTFSGSWRYFAEGGILKKPTIFGFDGNRPMVGGEAGAEAIAPIDTLQSYVSDSVAAQNKGLAQKLDIIISLLQLYMPEIMKNEKVKVILDSGALVGELAPEFDAQLGSIMSGKERGR